MTIAYRPAEIADCTFVVPLWSRSTKSAKASGNIADEDWASVQHVQIQKLLNRPGTRTIVAYENTDPGFLYGFIAGDTTGPIPVVHFCYVKEAYRQAGYARGLFAALGVDPEQRFFYTYFTTFILKLSAKIPRTRHEPVLMRKPLPEREDEIWKR